MSTSKLYCSNDFLAHIARSFLQDLKKSCLKEDPGNVEFWKAVVEKGLPLSLIHKSDEGAENKTKISAYQRMTIQSQ